MFSTIGISTTLEYLVPSSGSLLVAGDSNFSQSIGVGTTAHQYRINQGWTEVISCYGGLGVIDNPLQVHNGQLNLDPNSVMAVGILTGLCAVDFANAGSGPAVANANFMRLPHCTSAERVGLITQTGALIYNETNGDYQAYSDNQWVSLKPGKAGVFESINSGTTLSRTGVSEITIGGSTFSCVLPNATTVGDIKILVVISDSAPPTNTCTVTPTTLVGGTSLRFTTEGQSATLLYTSAGWVVTGGNDYTII